MRLLRSSDQEKHFQKKAERQNDHLKFKAVISSDMKHANHVAASVSDCCLCHGSDQHMLLVATLCVHRTLFCACVYVCVCV